MSRDIDWKETEWLVSQLRAKLEEDRDPSDPAALESRKPSDETADPALSMPATAPRQDVRKARQKKRKSQSAAPSAPKSAPSVTNEPATQQPLAVEEAPTAEQDLPTEESLIAEKGIVFEEDITTQEAQIEPSAEQESPAIVPPVTKIKRQGLPPMQKRTALFATSHEQEALPEFRAIPRDTDTAGLQQSTPEAQLQTQEEMRAEETVEDLLHDLFGDAEGSGWFTDHAPSLPPQEKPKEKKESVFSSATQRIKKNEPAKQEPPIQPPTEQPIAAPSAAVAAAPTQSDFETITRERDGQIALVLPETGRPLAIPSGESERLLYQEEQPVNADDEQLGLFHGENTNAAEIGKDPVRERIEFKRSIESSDEDFRLLLDLDYENELGSAIGFEKICAYHEEGVNGQAVVRRRRRRATEKREYEVQGQDTALRKQYTKQKREHVLRLAFCAVLTVLIWIYEQTAWMANLFGGPFDGEKYPVSYILIGIQLLVLLAFCSGRRIFKGFVKLVHFSPIDCSLCSVILLVTLLYHLVLMFLPHTAAPALYLSPAAMSLSMLALADLLDWYRESLAFQVVSSRKQKYALIPRVSVGGKEGDARCRLAQSDAAGQVWYLRPVGFVRNYFANTQKRAEHIRSMGTQLLLIASVGVSLGLCVLATGGTATQMLQTVFVTFLLCVPAASLFLTSLPLFLAACLRLRKKGAIIGEAPIDQCDGTTTLVLPDSEVFGAMHHERFELIGDQDPFLVSVLTRALLEKIQSPLCDSVSIDRDHRINPDQVVLNEIAEQGVSATVGEQKIPVLMGNVAYMQAHGVSVQDRWTDAPEHRGKRLICVAVKEKIAAIFLARYRLADDMKALLGELEAQGVQITVRSKDPGVNNDLFLTLLPDRKDAVRVMKPSVSEIDLRTDRVDTTVVALGTCREAARTFVTCRRIRRARNLGKLLQILSIAGGAALAGLLVFLVGSVRIPAILVSLYLLLWCGVHAVTSYFYLRDKDNGIS